MPAPPPQRPYFHVHAKYVLKRNRFYRVYVFPRELLFIQAGPGAGTDFALSLRAGGGLIGALIGQFISKQMQKRTQARQKNLDEATEDDLLAVVHEDRHNLQASFDDLSEVRIDSRSALHASAYGSPEHIGLLKFRHPDFGKQTMEFLRNEDLKTALEVLPPALEDKLTVNVVWDETRQKFVRRT